MTAYEGNKDHLRSARTTSLLSDEETGEQVKSELPIITKPLVTGLGLYQFGYQTYSSFLG